MLAAKHVHYYTTYCWMYSPIAYNSQDYIPHNLWLVTANLRKLHNSQPTPDPAPQPQPLGERGPWPLVRGWGVTRASLLYYRGWLQGGCTFTNSLSACFYLIQICRIPIRYQPSHINLSPKLHMVYSLSEKKTGKSHVNPHPGHGQVLEAPGPHPPSE